MSHPLANLPALAERLRRGDPDARRDLHDVEACVELLIRTALRSGAGLPLVVNWVRAHLPEVPDGDAPETAAPLLAQEFCDDLLSRCRPRPALCPSARETVRGW
jgi:hypothetical protein